MEFTTAHLQFVKSTAISTNRSKQNSIKFPTFWWDPKYFYPEISNQIKYNFNINLYYVKIQQNIALATINEIKIFNIQK